MATHIGMELNGRDGYAVSDRARVGTRIGDGVVHVDLLAPEPGSNWQPP